MNKRLWSTALVSATLFTLTTGAGSAAARGPDPAASLTRTAPSSTRSAVQLSTQSTVPPSGRERAVPSRGSGSAPKARGVTLRTLAPGPPTPEQGARAASRHRYPLASGPAGPVRTGHKPTATPQTGPGGPNREARIAATGPRTGASVVRLNTDGLTQATSNCPQCQHPDATAAIGYTQIVEAVNGAFQVYNRDGGALCGNTLNAFLGTDLSLSAPRVQFDNVNNRYTLSATPVPPPPAPAPATYFLAASQGADACGGWWIYALTFNSSLAPPGTVLESAHLGQDRGAVLASTNNFDPGFLGSMAWSIPKSTLYAGGSLSFPLFNVSFDTAPAVVAGTPMAATNDTFWLAALPTTGYNLYRMNNSAGPGTTLVLQATISSPYRPPLRRVNQPGTSVTLDPQDGTMTSAPVQDGDYLWFTHGQDLSGYPAIRYGAIGVRSNAAFVANAFRSGTSDDFNSSIGVSDNGAGQNYVWLNWAYTDVAAGRAATMTTNGVGPGEGVPTIGDGTDLVAGSVTSNFSFGDYSSVSVDPVAANADCPAGRVALLTQEYFDASGAWRTRLASLGFC